MHVRLNRLALAMSPSLDRREVLADDGLRARDNGEWAVEKLDFISTFAPPALKATAAKRSRWYVDLFAGPGINVIRGSARQIEGSALRAIELTAPRELSIAFTDAIFVNRDHRDHRALNERLAARVAAGRCRIAPDRLVTERGDANELISRIMGQIHPRAYAFVFADMEAPRQFPWTSVQTLRASGHESVDLYMLFPLDMALKRLLSTNPCTVAQCSATLTSFYGTDEWRLSFVIAKGVLTILVAPRNRCTRPVCVRSGHTWVRSATCAAGRVTASTR